MTKSPAHIINVIRWVDICLFGLCIGLIVYWLVFIFVVVGLASVHLDMGEFLGVVIPVVAGLVVGGSAAKKASAKLLTYSATMSALFFLVFGVFFYMFAQLSYSLATI
jgi:hypothetical protein